MPSFTFKSPSPLIAGQVYNPLIGWQYEYAPFPCTVKLIANAPQTNPADSVTVSITSGAEQIQEASPVQAVAVSSLGMLPSELNTPSVQWLAPAGDRLKLNFVSQGAGPDYVQGTIYINPIARGR